MSARVLKVLQATASMLVLAAFWQFLSWVFPHFLFPPVPDVLARTIEILVTGSLLADVLLTAGRIFGGLFGAFIFGAILALAIGQSKTIENFVTPVLTFFQGLLQRAPVHMLHHHGRVGRMILKTIRGRQMHIPQLLRGQHLPAQARQVAVCPGPHTRQKLQGKQLVIQVPVLRQPHHAHPAAAQQLHQFIALVKKLQPWLQRRV